MRSTLIVLGSVGVATVVLLQAALQAQDRKQPDRRTAPGVQRSAEPAASPDADLLAYGVGYYVGQDIRRGLQDDGVQVDYGTVARGFWDAMQGNDPAMDQAELDRVMKAVHREMANRAAARRKAEDPAFAKLCDENLARSKAYMEAFAKQDGVVVLDSGIAYKVVKAGTGAKPGPKSTVVVKYRSATASGQEIEDVSRREMEVASTLPAVAALLQSMPAGSHWIVAVPPDKAHGEGGDPPLIGPNEAIVLDAELLEVK